MKFSALMSRLTERGGQVVEVRTAGADPDVSGVCDDSRKAKAGDLFVARAGTKADGAKFIEDAVARGAVAVVIASPGEGTVPECVSRVPHAVVANTNLACALLAHEVAGNPTRDMKVLGVTGTKGKTTVAYLLRSVLKEAGARVGMIGTVEIDDGAAIVPADMTTPGSVELVGLFARMKANGVTHCVMEVSSHALHQHRVAGVEFAVGIFTNLTGDHLDYHRTMEEYAAAKAMLFERLTHHAMAVVNVDDAWAERMMRAAGAGGNVVTFGVEGVTLRGAEWTGTIEDMRSDRMCLRVRGPGVDRRLDTPLVGRHNAYNLLSVIAAAGASEIAMETVFAALGRAAGAPGRLQRVSLNGTPLPFQVFVDYAHTHDALENVLMALRATMGTGRLLCVFGCGGDRDRTKRPKMGRVAESLADRVFVTSDNPRTEDPAFILGEICTGFTPGWQSTGKVTVEADRRAAIRAAIKSADRGDVVLIAGKGHENYQIIGTTKHHFDDVEEAAAALSGRLGAGSGR